VEGVDNHLGFDQYPKGSMVDVGAVSPLCNDASIIGNDDVNGENRVG
jgi:hypothetical protein